MHSANCARFFFRGSKTSSWDSCHLYENAALIDNDSQRLNVEVKFSMVENRHLNDRVDDWVLRRKFTPYWGCGERVTTRWGDVELAGANVMTGFQF